MELHAHLFADGFFLIFRQTTDSHNLEYTMQAQMQLASLHNKFKTGYKHEIKCSFNQYKHTTDVIAGPSI